MAMFPCSSHLGRYTGPASAAYPALLTGAASERRKLRLCGPCLETLLEDQPVHPLLIDTNGDGSDMDDQSRACFKHPDLEAKSAFFLAAYKKGAEGETYYAPVCTDCADALAGHWGLR